jgi:predicted Zn finger-like uncharacterized protein
MAPSIRIDEAMMIVCPSCATGYRIELESLGEKGRQVRCARCRTVWLATADSAVAAEMLDADMAGAGHDASPTARATMPQRGNAGQDFPEGEWSAGESSDANREDEPADIAQAPPLVPAPETSAPGDAAASPIAGEDIETIAARRARAAYRPAKASRFKLSRPRLPTIILMLAATLAALILWRTPIVRLLPQTASLFAAVGLPVNVRGLSFEDLKALHEIQDGMPVLVVEGTIVNVTRAIVEVPRLRFALRNSLAQEVYAWTALPARSTLGPGEALAFRTRLASPPADGRDVAVRFFTRHDLITGVR